MLFRMKNLQKLLKPGLLSALALLASAPALAATAAQKKELNLRELTDTDVDALAKKLAAALASCPHRSPDDQVVATVTNQTDEFIDKTKVAETIREVLKPKKSVPEITPLVEVRARLTSAKSETKQKKKRLYKGVYTLAAEVFQDDKKICEKAETLEKSGLID